MTRSSALVLSGLVLSCIAPALMPPAASASSVGPVGVRFDATDPRSTPFPSDLFTVAAPQHLTGRQVRLPLPDCEQQPQPSDCFLIASLNTLDGFNLQPRLSIPF